ncbi:MAG: winged helix-turn-helix domain-containing protein [Candidatus Kryptoniota bacterium]
MTDFDYKQLDDTLQSRIRVAIMAVLVSVVEADFNFLKDVVKATDGNLSTHLRKLEDAGYIFIKKKFVERKPQTSYKMTEKGRRALDEHINALERVLKK